MGLSGEDESVGRIKLPFAWWQVMWELTAMINQIGLLRAKLMEKEVQTAGKAYSI